jgi:hypothetical protein
MTLYFIISYPSIKLSYILGGKKQSFHSLSSFPRNKNIFLTQLCTVTDINIILKITKFIQSFRCQESEFHHLMLIFCMQDRKPVHSHVISMSSVIYKKVGSLEWHKLPLVPQCKGMHNSHVGDGLKTLHTHGRKKWESGDIAELGCVE